MREKKKNFQDLAIGDIAVVTDEYAHDYTEHSIVIKSVEHDKDCVTSENPNGLVYYGNDVDETEFGDDYITRVGEENYLGCVKI